MKQISLRLMAALLIVFSWIVMCIIVPPFHTPDEPSHYENVIRLAEGTYPYQVVDKTKKNVLYVDSLEHLYDNPNFSPRVVASSSLWHKSFYTRQERRTISKENFQSYHPFLNPLLLAPAQFITRYTHLNLIDQYYIVRIYNSLFYFGTVYVVFLILKLISTDEKKRLAALLFFALNPYVVKSFLGINPDNAVAFFSLLFLFVALRTKVSTAWSLTLLSVLAGCSYLSKMTGVATLFVLVFMIWMSPGSLYNKIGKALYVVCLFVLTVSPWIHLMLSRYHTLSSSAVVIAWNSNLAPHSVWQSALFGVLGLRHTIMHYAGFFGPQNNVYPSPLFFYGYTICFAFLCYVGVVRSTNIFRKKIEKRQLHLMLTYGMSFLLFLSLLGFYFYWSGAAWDIQGRYALALFPILCFFVVESGIAPLFPVLFVFLQFFTLLVGMYIPRVCESLPLFSCLTGLHPGFYEIWVIALICWVLLEGVFIYRYVRKQ